VRAWLVSKPFDATVKDLLEAYPADWPECFGLPRPTSVEVVEAGLPAAAGAPDKILRISGPSPCLLQLELLTTYDPDFNQRVLEQSILLNGQHKLPVYTAALLLRPEADGSAMTGHVQRRHPDGTCYLDFRYQMIRVWQRPVESFLTGGLGTLPLAPISALSRDELPSVVRRMDERIKNEGTPGKAASLWGTAYVLMGLRYPKDLVDQLLSGVNTMKESVTYQAILEQGRIDGLTAGVMLGMNQGALSEARRILNRLGRKRLGPAEPNINAAIIDLEDTDKIEALCERLDEVSTWEELFGEPRGKRKDSKPKKKS
jgi:hypothetical protein